jgi:FkbM family methyltransferase
MQSIFYKRLKIKIKQILGKPITLNELAFSYINSDFNILEAGAHNGNDTKRLAQLTNNMVYAFEPIPELHQLLINSTKSLKNVLTFKTALADKNGELPMFISSGGSDASSSLLIPHKHLEKNPEVVFNRETMVKVQTLDQWAKENHVKKIDFMWLDMQGSEYAMLKASKEIFPTVKILYTEISTLELYAKQGIYSEYKNWLQQSGFTLIREELPWDFTGNALFLRK